MISDLKFTIRQLLKNPGFTAIAVLTLALGIGANTAVFSLINALLLKPLQAREPAQVIGVYQQKRTDPGNFRFFSYDEFAALRGSSEAFDDVLAYNLASVGLAEGDLVREVRADLVTPNYFSVLGVPARLGRTIAEEDDRTASPVAVLSHTFWKRLGSDPDIVGKPLQLTRGAVTVIGVMPEGFTGCSSVPPALFLPARTGVTLGQGAESTFDHSGRRWMIVGRLRRGISLETAAAPLEVVSARLSGAGAPDAGEWRLHGTPPSRFGFSNRPGMEFNVFKRIGTLAMGFSILVLIAACLNLANMMLARGVARRKEIAVRLAIGATRRRILRERFLEGAALALLGGAAGLALSIWCASLLVHFINAGLRMESLELNLDPDLRLFAVLLGFCFLATVFFAVGPGWALARINFGKHLKDGVQGDSRPGRFWLLRPNHALLTLQLAVSLALLVAAAFFTRSAMLAMKANPGFDYGANFLAQISGRLTDYDALRVRALLRDVTERIGQLPGVESVSAAMFVPFGMQTWDRGAQAAEAADQSDESKKVSVTYNSVGADYFRTMGLPLVRGRDFTRAEVEAVDPLPIAIISQNLADKLWPGQDPLDRTLVLPEGENKTLRLQVVGVVPNFSWDLFDKQTRSYVFVPFNREFTMNPFLHVRVAQGMAAEPLMRQVREELRRLDPRLPLTAFSTMRTFHRDSVAVRAVQVGAMLFGAFGVTAALLSFVGVFGLQSYSAARRTREFGIRSAIGASRSDLQRLVLGEGAKLGLTGLGLGLVLAFAVYQVAKGFLYGLSSFDPATFLAAPLLLLAITLFACWIPARRAARVEPMEALRNE